jgi:transcriptional regulator with XRE-family HTH domain
MDGNNRNSRFKDIRKYFRLTQAQFATELGLSHPQRIIEIEKKGFNISAEIVLKLVYDFGVDRHWLETGKGRMIFDEKKANAKLGIEVHDKPSFNWVKEPETPNYGNNTKKSKLKELLKKVRRDLEEIEDLLSDL